MVRTDATSRTARLEAVVTGIVALIVAFPFWRPDKYFAGFDTVAYSAPNHAFTVSEWKAGRLPLWNDMIFGGVAHLGNTQAGVLYPVRLLFAGFGTNRAIDLMIATHLVALALGMRWFARRLGLRPPAGFVIGVGAVLNGASLVKAIQFEQFLVLAWTPFVLVAVHAVITSNRPWRMVPVLALVGAAVLSAGHPQLIYLVGSFTLCITVALMVGTRSWRRLAPLTAGGVLAAAIGSLQLLATAAAYGPSALSDARRNADLARADWTLEPGRVLAALLGTVRNISPDNFMGAFEIIASVGVVVVFLASIGLVAAPADPMLRRFPIVVFAGGLVATVFAMGERSVLFRVTYDHLPGFSAARVPARWMVMTALCLVLLAGLGVDAIARGAVGRRELRGPMGLALIITFVLATGLAEVPLGRRTVAVWILLALVVGGVLSALDRNAARAGLVAALLCGLSVAELGTQWTRGSSMRALHDTPFESASAPTTTATLQSTAGWAIALTNDDLGNPGYLVPALRPNANVLAGVASLDGYDGGVQVTRRWLSLVARQQDSVSFDLPLRNQLPLPLSTRVLARMNVRWVVLAIDRDRLGHVAGWDGPIVTDDRFAIYENPEWLGAAVLWPDSASVDSPESAAELLRSDLASLQSTALVEAAAPPVDCTTGCAAVPAELRRVNARDLRVTTAADFASVVSVGAQFDEGWQATIDGEPADTFAIDGFFLGTYVPAGAHDVQFRYRPDWLTPALLFTALGLLGAGALAIGERRYHRRHHGDRDPLHHG